MDILYITNIPSPYRVKYFNELGNMCNLSVIFERGESDERDSSWNNFEFNSFDGIIAKGIKIGVDKAFTFTPLKYIKKKPNAWIIVSNPMTLSGMMQIAYMKIRRIKYWIEGDGAFTGEENKLKSYIKKKVLSKAAGYLSTCKNHDNYYLKYGAEENRIYRYPFSSITESDIAERPLSSLEKAVVRKELGITEKRVIICVGQFIPRKGFDLLIDIAYRLGEDVGIYFVGGDNIPEIQDNERMHVIPFRLHDELIKYYDAADVFVLPTREDIWGLVVNEAMGRGLPIITTDRCNAGLELVKSGENGYIIESENREALAERLLDILNRDDLYQMGERSLEIIREYTIGKMAERHLEILNSFI